MSGFITIQADDKPNPILLQRIAVDMKWSNMAEWVGAANGSDTAGKA